MFLEFSLIKILNVLFGLKDDKERRKKEIRERLEAEIKSTKKKGFMTPERKKKLRVGLR